MSDHPSLAGPLARLERADELVTDLEKALRAFLSDRPYTVEERRQVDAMVKVAPAPSGFVLPNLATVVAFMEPGPVFGKPIDHILRNLSNMTRQTVLTFADCF